MGFSRIFSAPGRDKYVLSSKLNDAGVVFLVPGSLECISELSSLENSDFHAFRQKTIKKIKITRCTVEIEWAHHAVSCHKLTLLIGENTKNTRGPSHVRITAEITFSFFALGWGGPGPPNPGPPNPDLNIPEQRFWCILRISVSNYLFFYYV